MVTFNGEWGFLGTRELSYFCSCNSSFKDLPLASPSCHSPLPSSSLAFLFFSSAFFLSLFLFAFFSLSFALSLLYSLPLFLFGVAFLSLFLFVLFFLPHFLGLLLFRVLSS